MDGVLTQRRELLGLEWVPNVINEPLCHHEWIQILETPGTGSFIFQERWFSCELCSLKMIRRIVIDVTAPRQEGFKLERLYRYTIPGER